MTIYLLARLFAWFYGFDWPLADDPRSFIAVLSAVTFPFELAFVGYVAVPWAVHTIKKERKSK